MRLGVWDITTDVDCAHDDCTDRVHDFTLAEIIPHEDYVPDSSLQINDIALIRLSSSVRFTDWINPICLPIADSTRNIKTDGHSFTIGGWGKTENSTLCAVY